MSSILVSIFMCVVLHKDERQAMLSLCLPFIFLILPAIETKLRVTSHMYAHCKYTHTCTCMHTANILTQYTNTNNDIHNQLQHVYIHTMTSVMFPFCLVQKYIKK